MKNKIIIKKLHITINGNIILIPDNASSKQIKDIISEASVSQKEQK